MKNMIWAILILILAVIFVLEFRYTLVVNTPIVAKIDRLTGDVWIANSGMWRKVQHSYKEDSALPQTQTAPAVPSSKAKDKAK